MTENLKFVVQEVNSVLGTDYNLISFDSLPADLLLQILVDVFSHFGATEKVEVRDNDPEETNRLVMDSLRRVQYRPSDIDPISFRTSLVHGDKKVIHPILSWVFENKTRVKKTIYLAKFLIPLDLPPEAISIPEVSNLWSNYLSEMDDFKEAHKMYEKSLEEGAQTKELRSDIGAIESEIENVKKRIERTQARLDKVPQQELLLEASHHLRIERERQKELQSQIEEQKQGLQRANTLQERFKKELNNARLAAQGASPKTLLETIVEEAQVLEFMVQQKLPQELTARQTEVQILEDILGEPNLGRDYLYELQGRIEEVNGEVQRLMETKMNERGGGQNDALGAFRQQAGIVARKKEAAAEKLDQLSMELRDIEGQLQDKQSKLQETIGEVILRGDDLKQFVNTLRAKSNVYKEQRSQLATMRAEAADLSITLENLKAQDPSLASLHADEESLSLDNTRPASPIEGRGMAEVSRLIEGLNAAIKAARERVTPLTQQLRPLRERVTDLQDEKDVKKQSYTALNATLSAEQATMQGEINEHEKTIKKLEEDWQDLQHEYSRLQLLQEKTKEQEAGNTNSLRDTLSEQIRKEEKSRSQLAETRTSLENSRENRSKQQEMWRGVLNIFDMKMKCFREAKNRGIGGTISKTRDGAETFTLQ